MNTAFFRYAIEVDRTRSITQAAENLFIAQPNLSKAIRDMEGSLGFDIFKRTSKGVTPTKKGLVFLDYARKVASQLEEIEALSGEKQKSSPSLGIVIPRSSYIAAGVTEFIAEMHASCGVDWNIHETNSLQAIQDVVDGEVTLGIIRYHLHYEPYYLDYLQEMNLKGDPLWEFQCMVLMSKAHPLAGDSRLRAEDLKPYTQIVYGDNVIPHYASVPKQSAPDESPSKRRICLYERCNQYEVLSGVPETYMWAAPVPDRILTRYDLVQRKCEYPGNEYKDMLIYRKGYRFSELENKLIAKLNEAKNEVSFRMHD